MDLTSFTLIARRFEELDVWKLSRKFAESVYRITSIDPFARDFGLRDQLRRSSGSIMDNIAEGFERDGKKEFIQFLYIAKASCGESRSQLYRAKDANYLEDGEFELLKKEAEFISTSLSNFIKYLKKSEYTGLKNRTES